MPGIYDLKKIWHPAFYQGNLRKRRYFEGWYFKQVGPGLEHSLAVIPGISLTDTDHHAFVQVINGENGQTWYFRYPTDAFRFSKKNFAVSVAGNHFWSGGMELNLDSGNSRISGKLRFREQTPYPATFKRPGIMGWYRYMPMMECYHGLVSLDHRIEGALELDGKTADFTGGRGYIEKDWGRSMPLSWIWMQTNHFKQVATSMMLSVARIPWMGSSFTGFLGFLLYGGRLITFATHTGARIIRLEHHGQHTDILIRSRDFQLSVRGMRKETPGSKGSLKAPSEGLMQRIIHESLRAEIAVELSDKNGRVLFEEVGRKAGLEMVGDISLLRPGGRRDH